MATTSKASQWRGWLECYFAGLTIMAVVAPLIAITVTFIMAISNKWTSDTAVLLGLLVGLGGWIVLALVATHFVTIDRAYPSVYRQICSRFQILQEQLDTVEPRLKERVKEDPIAYALAEAQKYRSLLQALLEDGNPATRCNPLDWIGALGYIRLEEQLHRMEESLILLAPLETVLSDAWHDKQRLEGSTIGNRQELLDYLQESQAHLSIPLKNTVDQPHSTKQLDSIIRQRLRYVRRSINEFRDEQRFGLVRARNRLLKTVALTGCICFALTMVAVITIPKDPQKTNLIAAAVFFLVGAIVGLFNQLRLDAGAETATEDYGLTTARLFHTPLFSGLAALGGVLVIPLLSFLVSGTPPDASIAIHTLADAFKLAPSNLVLAVIFGLSPTALLSRLQQEAERYKTELRRSEASTPGPVVDADSSQHREPSGIQTVNQGHGGLPRRAGEDGIAGRRTPIVLAKEDPPGAL